MGKRYVLPIPVSPKKFKFDEEITEKSEMSKELVVNSIVTDLFNRKWRIGKPIGRGSFGEIYLASNVITSQVTESAEYVIKIEPHSSGPLFAEINCLVRTGRITEDCTPAAGVPTYIASGSHIFLDKRYRFMIIPRYRVDLHYLLKKNRVSMKNILIIAVQILDILEYIHSKGFAHSDIKAQNLMIGVEKTLNIVSQNLCNSNMFVNEISTTLPSRQLRFVHTRMCNPFRECRTRTRSVPDIPEVDRTSFRSLRIKKNVVNYKEHTDDDSDFSVEDEDILPLENNPESKKINSERIFLIDYGLASKFINSKGFHRMFSVDERRAHDGTLEYSSRDAHFGAHSRRSDLECLGYNLLDWITGDLPWKDETILLQPELVHRIKVCFMNNIKQMMDYCYNGRHPIFILKYLEYVGDLEYTEDPDYDYCRSIFLTEYKRLGYSSHDMELDFSLQYDLHEFKCTIQKPCSQNLDAHSAISIYMNEHTFKRCSPKNLRSKQVEAHGGKKLRSKSSKPFSWTDILCNEAEHLLQEKLEEMCCGDDSDCNCSNNNDIFQYEGKPTYAIKLVLKSIKEAKNSAKKCRSDERKSVESVSETDGLTYAMRIVLERKNIRDNKENINRIKKTITKVYKNSNSKICKRTKLSSKNPKQILHTNQGLKSIVDVLKANKCVRFMSVRKISQSNVFDNIKEDISDVRLRSYKKRSPINIKNNKREEKKQPPKKISLSKSTGTRKKSDNTRKN